VTRWSRPAAAVQAILTKNKRWVICAQLAAVIAAGVVLVYWLEPSAPVTANLQLLWRNALPLSLVALLIYGLCGRAWLSILATGGVSWLIFAVNLVKEQQMNAPLMPADWVLRGQLLRNLAFFWQYVGRGITPFVEIVGFLIVAYFLWRLESKWPRPGVLTRLVLALISVTLLFTAFRGDPPWSRIYSKKALPDYQMWDPIASARDVGLVANFIKMAQESRLATPAPDKSVVSRFAKKHAADLESRLTRPLPSKLPDIVAIQSEAFFEPGILRGIESGEFTPNFHRLAAGGITGKLVTPAFGGGTIRTEFEVLTGYPLRAFPSVVYPYYGFAKSWMPTVPRRLRALGYSTTLIHPFRADFYNRQVVMPLLGFDHTHFSNDFKGAEHAGYYVSDRALFTYALSRLHRRSAQPKFMMLITIENHGPWDHEPIGVEHALDGHVLPDGLSASGRRQLIYYLAHLVNGDAALGRLVKKLMARRRWTILLFYGDHLPTLTEAFSNLGFDDGNRPYFQSTRYMLLSNRPIGQRHLDVSAYQLPGLLFDVANLPEDGYLSFDAALRQAEANEKPEGASYYEQVYLAAAQMEVSCRTVLSPAGDCT